MSFVGYLITVFALLSAVVFAGLYLKGVRSPEALGAWLGRRMVRIKGFARGHPVLFALVVLPALPFALTGVLVAAFYAVLLMLLFRTLNGADPDATDTCEPQTGFSDDPWPSSSGLHGTNPSLR